MTRNKQQTQGNREDSSCFAFVGFYFVFPIGCPNREKIEPKRARKVKQIVKSWQASKQQYPLPPSNGRCCLEILAGTSGCQCGGHSSASSTVCPCTRCYLPRRCEPQLGTHVSQALDTVTPQPSTAKNFTAALKKQFQDRATAPQPPEIARARSSEEMRRKDRFSVFFSVVFDVFTSFFSLVISRFRCSYD